MARASSLAGDNVLMKTPILLIDPVDSIKATWKIEVATIKAIGNEVTAPCKLALKATDAGVLKAVIAIINTNIHDTIAQ